MIIAIPAVNRRFSADEIFAYGRTEETALLGDFLRFDIRGQSDTGNGANRQNILYHFSNGL